MPDPIRFPRAASATADTERHPVTEPDEDRITNEPSDRERLATIVNGQPSDARFDDILRELAFDRLVRRGLNDLAAGRMVTTAQLNESIRSWRP